MSSMLKQAIVDAAALKESALKTAEQTLVEKYSSQIKEAVEKLLEQDEEELDTDIDVDADLEMEDMGIEEKPDSKIEEEIPLAVGEDEEEEIEIDFGELERAIDEIPEMDAEDMVDREDTAEEITGEEPGEELGVGDEVEEIPEEEPELEFENQELVDLLEEIAEDLEIEEIEEELKVDLEKVPMGQMNTNKTQKEFDKNIEAAKENENIEDEEEDKLYEEIKKINKQLKQLKERNSILTNTNENINKENKQLKEENKKQKEMLIAFKNKINEVNLSNAKLLYTNKVLDSISLNEKQKNKIVEAISKTSNVKEVKMVFEMLKSTVGMNKDSSKSLNEVLANSSRSLSLKPRDNNKEEVKTDPNIDRMKILAGIKN